MTTLIVSVTRISSSPFTVNTLYTPRTRKYTLVGVFLCSASFLCPTTHTEHKKTPSLSRWCLFVFGVSRVTCCFLILQCMPSMKWHLVGVFSCSALFLRPTTHAEHEITPTMVSFHVRCFSPPAHTEHEKTPSLVSFPVRHLYLALPHMPSIKWHPRWCYFVLGSFPALSRVVFYVLLNTYYIF